MTCNYAYLVDITPAVKKIVLVLQNRNYFVAYEQNHNVNELNFLEKLMQRVCQ